MPPIGIAVIGAGPWGLTLTRAFASLPRVRIRWICERDDERRARAGAAHPGARLTGELDAALGDPEVAAVVVAVDPARHHAVGLRALEAGKHLFVEKPLALSARDAEQLCVAAATRGLLLTVGHLLLHHPAIRRARQIVAKGSLGEPLSFTSTRATPGAPRRPGSAWWALAPHDVSLALHMFDTLPAAVSANGVAWSRAREDSAARAVLQFAGTRTANVSVARFAADKRREMTLTGAKATLTFDELGATDQALRLWTPQQGTVVLPGERVDPLLGQCLDFVTRVARGDVSGGSGTHALAVVRVLEAGDRSMHQSGAPVAVTTASPESASFEAA